MIDTFHAGYKIAPYDAAALKAFAAACQGKITSGPGSYDVESGVTTTGHYTGVVSGLGRCTLHDNTQTGYISLPFDALPRWEEHLRTGKELSACRNVHVLTARSAAATFQAVTERAEKLFDGLLQPDALTVSRVDVVYQRQVHDAMQVLTSLQGAIRPVRGGRCQWFETFGQTTGLILKGDAVTHRAYDKGRETGDGAYHNVLRSEEQLRGKSAALARIVNVNERTFSREECFTVINDRYAGTEAVQVIDVQSLVAAGQAELALYVLHPELLDIYKAKVTRPRFYGMRSKVRRILAAAVEVDMTLPADAWTE